MKKHIPVALFDLLEKHKDDPNKPESIHDIPALIIKCKNMDYDIAAKQLERWLVYMKEQIEAEWDETCLNIPL